MDIEHLNDEHGIPGVLRFTEGRGGLTLIEVENPHARATIGMQGAQVLAYRPRSAEQDLLFVSERAHAAPGRETKGGVPICWPWFGRDPEERGRLIHGFARVRPWTLLGVESRPDGSTGLTFALADDATTRALWPHPFAVRAEILIGPELGVALTAHNPGEEAVRITQGLHAYFAVGDATRVAVQGLDGCRYIDKAAGAGDAVVRQSGPVTVAAEVNRIYEEVPASLTLEDPVLARRIRIASEHSRTCVVWNPWIDSARAMEDLDDLDYRRFVCVETVNTASEVVELPPGGDCRIAAIYQVAAL